MGASFCDPPARSPPAFSRRSEEEPMLTNDSRRMAAATGGLAVLLAIAACNGNISHNAPTGAGGSSGLGGGNVKPGDVTVPPTPIPADVAAVAVRKVKNLLTGMPPTDEDVALVT